MRYTERAREIVKRVKWSSSDCGLESDCTSESVYEIDDEKAIENNRYRESAREGVLA